MSYSWPEIKTPKISVVVCNYNYDKFICSAIDSVVNQTINIHEIIVVDDGSTDNSVILVKQNFPQIKLVVKENEGQISAYNAGFNHVSGDVVIFLDSDDELLPNALEDISSSFKEHIVKVHGKMRIIDQGGIDLDVVLPSYLDSGDCGKQLVDHGLLYKSTPASGNAYRVSALKILFPIPFNESEKHGADYFCIYGISLLGLIGRVNSPIIKYRVHSSGEDKVNSLGFGNAIKMQDRQTIMQNRWIALTNWLNDRLKENFNFKENYLDFTQQKFFYALDILNAENFRDRFSVLRKKHFPGIFKALNARNDLNIIKKIVLYIWVVLVLVLPRRLSFKIAKWVCNPVK